MTNGNDADVNGLPLYYELHGNAQKGIPLVLLHGGYGATTMFIMGGFSTPGSGRSSRQSPAVACR